ncbi:MAG: hypothetical protein ABIJ92_04095 [Candidatus Aenigmatarchaeota archaeon]
MVQCKKCPFFDRKREYQTAAMGSIVMGFCKLREKFVTDQSINNELCKDKAVVDPQHLENLSQEKKDSRTVVTY